jgi:membrane protein YqaA with SNARE-associated domain
VNTSDNIKVASRNPLKRLYNWVLHWADTKYGTPALAVISFAESSFFPIPPDILQIALSVGKPKRSLYYAAINTIFSVSGAFFGYFIGFALMGTVGIAIIHFYHAEAMFESLKVLFNDNSFIAIVIAAFTPIPYKVFTITAGACSTPLLTLLLASILGRAGRFFAVGITIYIFGAKVKTFIDKYFDILSIVFTILVIGGIFVLTKIA